jgi:hypothetical protein
MTKNELVQELGRIVSSAVQAGSTSETICRASDYTLRRIEQGYITSIKDVKICWASFADGFCTGSGSCPHDR